MKTLYRKLTQKGFRPAHAAEVGVWRPETSNLLDYIEQGTRCTLVEPDPDSIALIRDRFGGLENVALVPVAVYDAAGEIELVRRAASTFVRDVGNSPAVVNDGYEDDPDDVFTVDARTFDQIDDGTIDLLSVDVEGAEWFVIKHMVSRPPVISIEMHGQLYVNPHADAIRAWMREHDYVTWYKDKSDTVFVKRGAIPIGVRDRLALVWTNAYLWLRRARKKLKRAVRKPRAAPAP